MLARPQPLKYIASAPFAGTDPALPDRNEFDHGATHALRKNLGHPCGRGRQGAGATSLYRSAFHSRGNLAAGVRRAEGGRAKGSQAGADLRGDGPLGAHQGSPQHHDHRQPGQAVRGARPQLPRNRRAPVRHEQPEPGHRSHHRPRDGHHPARADHRLRRQPHLHPRRVRRAGVRHRHQRGRDAFWPRSACRNTSRKPCWSASRASGRAASPPKT